ncbi:response regulator transcription factor [soil metagenome]
MRIVIGEDEALTRAGLALMLVQAGFDVVGTAGDADELVALTADRAPDLVITDIRMPPTHTDDGLRAAVEIRRAHPATAVVVLSQHVQRRYAVDLLGDEPSRVGYLLKDRIVDVENFITDVRRVGEGGTVLDPTVIAAMLSRTQRPDRAVEQLTPRQREVLALIAEGRSNGAIARQLNVSEKAVVQHASNIYDELGLPPSQDDHRRVLAVVRYLMR